MGSELKPCPFCAGEARIVHNEPYTLGAIVCDTCKALVMFPWYKTESQLDLKEEWDKRAEPEMQTLPVHTMPRCIDADGLKESLRQLEARGNNRRYVQGLQDAIDVFFPKIIDDAPTADVQPVRHGHWINGNCGDYVCSVCGWAFSDELPYMARKYDAETEEIMRYCMHCGAVMDEVQKEVNDK